MNIYYNINEQQKDTNKRRRLLTKFLINKILKYLDTFTV